MKEGDCTAHVRKQKILESAKPKTRTAQPNVCMHRKKQRKGEEKRQYKRETERQARNQEIRR